MSSSRPRFWTVWQSRQLDAVLALGIVLVLVLLLPPELAVWIRLLIAVGIGLPVAVRNIWQPGAFLITLGVSVVATALNLLHDSFVISAFVLYPLAVETEPLRPRLQRQIGWPTLGLLAFMLVAGSAPPISPILGRFLSGAAVLSGTWIVGQAVRERRRYVRMQAEQLARQAVVQERLRIARELHDVAAHTLGIITVQASVAQHLINQRPDAGIKALQTIEQLSRDSLQELRQVLGILRHHEPEILPITPDLGNLEVLIQQVAVSGVQAKLRLHHTEHLPDSLNLAAYRIVQEALTNIVKHAAPTTATVTIQRQNESLSIEIYNAAPAHPQPPSGDHGLGLLGMRERTLLLGGTFSAAPTMDGGFCVMAMLPYPAKGAHV